MAVRSIGSNLECASHCEPESAPLPGQEQPRCFFGKTKDSVRIIVIDQTERNIDNRHLNSGLNTETRPKIPKFVKRCSIDIENRIRLCFASKYKRLNARRDTVRTRLIWTEQPPKLSGRQQLILIIQERPEIILRLGVITQRKI